MSHKLSAKLEVENVSLSVRLGCTAEERSVPQEVRFSIRMGFDESPPGESTDQLQDTVCYADICETLYTMTRDREYNLVEKLAKDAFLNIRNQVPQSILVQVKVHKVHPPVPHLKGGVHYSCGDSLEW